MPARSKRSKSAPTKGDTLASVGPWTIVCNEPGYTMLVQYEDGKQRFLSHRGAIALAGALLEALRNDPVRPTHPL